jgi:hypothetical protein
MSITVPAPAVFQAAALQPLVAAVEPAQLQQLRTWMAAEGRRVNIARMCVDRRYAIDCLATGHASAFEPLRLLSLRLFAAYEQGMAGSH